jgi:hypothetical protein
VPIRVAATAANTPTKIEISAPLIALASTSRPSRSPPNGSVSAFGTSVIWIFAARSAHSLYFGASGSMSDRSTGLAARAARASGSASASFGAGPMKVGGAFGTPTSLCQSPAMTPTADARISSRNATTIASDTMPTRSRRRRRQAARHTPSERAGTMLAGAATIAVT